MRRRKEDPAQGGLPLKPAEHPDQFRIDDRRCACAPRKIRFLSYKGEGVYTCDWCTLRVDP